MNELLEQPRQIRKFNPGTFQSDVEVISQFVVRNRELGVVLDVLRGNAGSPSCQHVLLVGPRGRGKTMLLARIAAELRTDGDLSDQLLPIRFTEESHEIFNLGDFWLESLFYLARERGVRDPDLARELRDVHAALAAERHGRELEERARAAVLEIADRLGKRLVLMVENLQALCRDVDHDFGWKLRGVLQSEPQIILLATATSRFRELEDAEHAFFELFRIVRLEPLDTGECHRLWQMVTGDDVREREIRPLQILTGGDPRLLVIIGEFAQHRSLGQLMEDLVRLIDDHTEYFRAHLEGFAKTERRVYLALIDLWQPSTTGEIAARARLDVRIVSTLLGRLVERGAVVVEGNGKKRVYVAAQRLYSIYYKLRRERDEAAVVRNLIRFMAVFYTDDELTEMAGQLRREAVQSPIFREGIEQAIAETPQISRIFAQEDWQAISSASERAMAIGDKGAKLNFRETMGEADETGDGQVTEFLDRGLGSRRESSPHAPELVTAPVLWRRALAHRNRGEHEAEIATYDQIVALIGDSDVPELQVQVAKVLVNKGATQGQLGDAQAAMAAYDAVAARFGDSDVPELQVQVAKVLVNKGATQGQLGDAQAEMAAYDAVAARFGDSDAPEIQVLVAKALFNKGATQGQLGDAQAEMAAYDAVAVRFGDSDVPELQVLVAEALVNKGVTQGQLGDAQAAMATYDAVTARFGDSELPELQVPVAAALVNKGATQGQLGDAQAAMATYDAVAVRFGDSHVPELQVTVAKALFNKGVTQGQLGDAQAEMATYGAVAARFGDSDVPELQVQVAATLVNKGVTQGQLGDAQAAMATCDAVAARFGDSDVPELQVEVAKALFNKGVTQRELLGDAHAAMAAFDAVAARFGDSDVPELQVQVAKALFNKGVTQRELLGDAQAEMATYDAVAERFGDSDVPELQVEVAKALFNKGVTQRELLGDAHAAMAAFDAVAARFGDSDVPELQVEVAKALFNKGVTQRELLGDAQAEMATYDAVAERFGDSDVPELQAQVAKALFNKGVTQGQLGDAHAAMAAFDAVAARFGDSDVPELQVEVAKALFNKGVTQRELLGDAQAEMATYDAVAERFGDSDVPELQAQVAKALFNKGVTQGQLGDAHAAMAAFDAVAARFGDSDVPELQVQVAAALVGKGVTQGQLGDAHAAMAAFDAVAARFRDSDVLQLQMLVANALVNKAEAEIRLGRTEEALHTCEQVERRADVLAGIEKGALERRARWVRTRALLLLEQHTEAMDVFRSVYAVFVPGEDTMVSEMLEQVPNLIAAGASERDLVGVLSSESEKTDALMPLVVALRQRAGEVVRAPVEVLEIAADIRREIETKLGSGDDASLGASSA